jgi:outer membrane protein assembly factor BamB
MRIQTIFLLLVCVATTTRADDWPQWRGPTGQGQTTAKSLPQKWDAKTGENVLWKSPLPRGDNPYSSPIVKDGRVFVTLAMNKTREHHVLCFDATDGRQLWDTTVEPGPWVLTDLRGGYGAPTPVADDAHVYVLFGSAVLASLDRDGKVAWRKELPRHGFDVAIGCSPLPWKDTLILQADMPKGQSSLIAFDKATGDIRWEVKRPTVDFAHSTPTLIELGGKPLMLVAASGALQGVDPDTGQVVWSCKAKGDTVSPVFANGIAYVDSGRGGPGFAVGVEPGLQGDVTKTNLKWSVKMIPEGFSSPLIFGDHVYRLCGPGILKVFALADGAELSSQRLDGASSAPSPVATADGLIYVASAGKSYVLRPGTKPEIISTNDLGDPNYASPAVANDRLYLKGQRFLYCVGVKVH